MRRVGEIEEDRDSERTRAAQRAHEVAVRALAAAAARSRLSAAAAFVPAAASQPEGTPLPLAQSLLPGSRLKTLWRTCHAGQASTRRRAPPPRDLGLSRSSSRARADSRLLSSAAVRLPFRLPRRRYKTPAHSVGNPHSQSSSSPTQTYTKQPPSPAPNQGALKHALRAPPRAAVAADDGARRTARAASLPVCTRSPTSYPRQLCLFFAMITAAGGAERRVVGGAGWGGAKKSAACKAAACARRAPAAGSSSGGCDDASIAEAQRLRPKRMHAPALYCCSVPPARWRRSPFLRSRTLTPPSLRRHPLLPLASPTRPQTSSTGSLRPPLQPNLSSQHGRHPQRRQQGEGRRCMNTPRTARPWVRGALVVWQGLKALFALWAAAH